MMGRPITAIPATTSARTTCFVPSMFVHWLMQRKPLTPEQRVLQRGYDKKSYEKHRPTRILKSATWIADNYDHFKAERTRRRLTCHPVSYTLWRSAKQRAANHGIPFDITPDDIIVPEFCPALGLRLAVSRGSAKPHSPSLDRIVPELGYVPGNIQVLSHRANTIKSNASRSELEAIASFLRGVCENVDMGSERGSDVPQRGDVQGI